MLLAAGALSPHTTGGAGWRSECHAACRPAAVGARRADALAFRRAVHDCVGRQRHPPAYRPVRRCTTWSS